MPNIKFGGWGTYRRFDEASLGVGSVGAVLRRAGGRLRQQRRQYREQFQRRQDGDRVVVVRESTLQKAIKAYEKAHPGVTVNYTYYNYDPQFITALKAAAKSGTLPDIIGLPPGSLTQQYRADLTPVNALAAKTWGSWWEQKSTQWT